MSEMEEALAAHNLSVEMSAGVLVLTILVSLLVGLTIVFFYAVGAVVLAPARRPQLSWRSCYGLAVPWFR